MVYTTALFSDAQEVTRSQRPEEDSTGTATGWPGGIEGRGFDMTKRLRISEEKEKERKDEET